MPLVAKHMGIEIYVNNEGLFTAETDDVKLSAHTLKELQTRIESAVKNKKRTRELAVIGFHKPEGRPGSRQYIPIHTVLTGVNRTDRSLQFKDVAKGDNFEYVMPDTPANWELLNKIIEVEGQLNRLKVFHAERDVSLQAANVPRWGRIEANQYEDVLDKLTKCYDEGKALPDPQL